MPSNAGTVGGSRGDVSRAPGAPLGPCCAGQPAAPVEALGRGDVGHERAGSWPGRGTHGEPGGGEDQASRVYCVFLFLICVVVELYTQQSSCVCAAALPRTSQKPWEQWPKKALLSRESYIKITFSSYFDFLPVSSISSLLWVFFCFF